MAKRISRFTDRDIQRLKPAEKTYLQSEPDGLYVRVLPSGRKSFVTVYSFDGKQRWLTIGRYPEISLSSARAELAAIRKKIENKIDPGLAKQQERAEQINAPTVAEFAEEYLAKWAIPKKKSAKEDERILKKDVIPAWGKRKLKDITRRDIIKLIDDVAERGPIMANRTLAVIRKMLNFALNRDVIELSPCQNITPPGKETKKERVLSEDEIKALWPRMTKKLTNQTNRALKLILMTAQRPGEVASMQWNEIDGRWWTIPSDKTKNGKEHRVFLNDIALELIGKPRKRGFVFQSSRKPNHPVNQNAFGKALRGKMKNFEGVAYFSAHDLRRTAATHIARLGYGANVGKVLNHTDQSITAIYDRYSYDKEKQAALIAWSDAVANMIEATNKTASTKRDKEAGNDIR